MSKPVVALAVVLLAAAVYGNSLGNGFVWDDPIILSRQLPVFRTPLDVLAPPPNIPQFAPDYYRPLVVASYLVDRALGGGAAWVFHLTLVMAHALATLAVFSFGDELFRRAAPGSPSQATLAAALGAAAFAVHPVHTEAVAWVAGRADVFAGLFGVTAAWAHLRSREQPRFSWFAAASLLLALFAKEAAAGVLPLLPLLDLLVPDAARRAADAGVRADRRRRTGGRAASGGTPWSAARYAPLLLAVALYALLRLRAVGGGLTTTSGEVEGSLAADVLAALGAYAAKLLLPSLLNAYIADVPTGPGALIAGAVVLTLFLASMAAAQRRERPAVLFLCLWFAATLAPALTILFKIPDVPMAERYLYLPSVAFCLLAGYGAALALEAPSALARGSAAALVALLLGAGAVATARRNAVWASDRALWSDTALKSPSASLPLRSLGTALFHEGELDEAARVYERALALGGNAVARATIYNNLGTIALTRGDLAGAAELYRRAADLRVMPDAFYNLGVVHLRRAEQAKESGDEAAQREGAAAALVELRHAASANLQDADVELALGQALALLGRRDEAKTHLRRALDLGLAGPNAAQVRAQLDRP